MSEKISNILQLIEDAVSEKKKVNITYTSREFNSVRSDLLQHARKYYPT